MKQSIQHVKLLFASFLFSNLENLLMVDDDDDDDSESVRSFLPMVIVVDEMDERRSKFNETKQMLS